MYTVRGRSERSSRNTDSLILVCESKSPYRIIIREAAQPVRFMPPSMMIDEILKVRRALWRDNMLIPLPVECVLMFVESNMGVDRSGFDTSNDVDGERRLRSDFGSSRRDATPEMV